MAELGPMVTFAAPHTTVQDGRHLGLMRSGVPACGPMDRKALAAANLALGNDPGAPRIDASPGGPVRAGVSGSLTTAVAVGGESPTGWWIIAHSPTAMLLADPARPHRFDDREGVPHG